MLLLWIVGCIIGLIFLMVWIWYHPGLIFTPTSWMLRTLDYTPRYNIYPSNLRDEIFPVGKELELKWKQIRAEGYALYHSLTKKDINYLDMYHLDLGKEDKKNWTTLPLRLFGQENQNYMERCPTTTQIIQNSPEIISAIFSFMEPGKIIQPHVGPHDGFLRYQLPLDIPPGECYLYVGDEKHYWKEGQGVLFDETRLHGAVNKTEHTRLVLLIDIARPYPYLFQSILNQIAIFGMKWIPIIH